MLGWTLHHARDYAGSIAELERIRMPNNEVRLILAANHARLPTARDEKDAAARHAAEATRYRTEFLARRPDWTVDRERSTIHFERSADREHWFDGLKLAGLS